MCTLKGAQADALERWEDFAQKSAATAKKAKEGLVRVKRGELQVHHQPKSRVSTVTAFETTPFKKSKGATPRIAPLTLVDVTLSW